MNNLTQLRQLMKNQGIDTYIITKFDPHQSEITHDHYNGVKFISGFTGSSGAVLITQNNAYVVTDGRYYTQALAEMNEDFKLQKEEELSLINLATTVMKKGTIGFDGKTVSTAFVAELRKNLNPEITVVHDAFLLDDIWENKPEITREAIWDYPTQYSGESFDQKLARVRESMKKKGGDLYLISSLDDIAWLLNIRSMTNSVSFNFYAHLLITAADVTLFIDKMEGDVLPEVTIRPYVDILSMAKNIKADATLIYAPSRVNYSVSSGFSCQKIPVAHDITAEMKTCKNAVEIENLKIANEKDALAFTKLMKWLQTYSVGQDIDENDVRDRLITLREGIDGYLDLSFEPVCAYGPSAVLPHYRAGDTPRKIKREGFLKVDSGAHFIEGTTDITRTYVMGPLTEEMKINYTAVLKGHIALATAKFPKGTKGFQLDPFARRPLWELGLDYAHGTAHGIGHLLNVHEGPLNISPKLIDVPLEIGMLMSNEPGYYKEGEYGVRLENTILVVPDNTIPNGEFLKFETVSYVPFDQTAIIAGMLTQEEKDWLDDYHAKTYEKISVHLCENGKAWLKEMTAKISTGDNNDQI